MKSVVLCLFLLVSVAGCENSTSPFIGFGGGTGVTQTQATGNWSFTLTRTSALGCTGGSLTNGQVLTTHLDVQADGTLATATSTWQNPPTTVVRPLTGAVNLASGFTDLFLSPTAGSSAAMELQGTMNSAGSFSGTLTDPAPGSSPVFGACSYTATGIKS